MSLNLFNNNISDVKNLYKSEHIDVIAYKLQLF